MLLAATLISWGRAALLRGASVPSDQIRHFSRRGEVLYRPAKPAAFSRRGEALYRPNVSAPPQYRLTESALQ